MTHVNPIAPHLTLIAAFDLAIRFHAGQEDACGRPYVTHLWRVAARVDDPIDQAIAVCHDVVEDTPCTLDKVRALLGDEVADAVDALTKRGPTVETYFQAIARAKANVRARRVKLADLCDDADPARAWGLKGREFMLDRYRKARGILLDELSDPEAIKIAARCWPTLGISTTCQACPTTDGVTLFHDPMDPARALDADAGRVGLCETHRERLEEKARSALG